MNTTLQHAVNHKPGDWSFLLANPPTLPGPEPSRASKPADIKRSDKAKSKRDATKDALLSALADGKHQSTTKLTKAVGEAQKYVLQRMDELEDDRKVMKVRGVGSTWLWRLK